MAPAQRIAFEATRKKFAVFFSLSSPPPPSLMCREQVCVCIGYFWMLVGAAERQRRWSNRCRCGAPSGVHIVEANKCAYEWALSNQNLLHQNESNEEKMCKIFKLCRYERFDAQQSLCFACRRACAVPVRGDCITVISMCACNGSEMMPPKGIYLTLRACRIHTHGRARAFALDWFHFCPFCARRCAAYSHITRMSYLYLYILLHTLFMYGRRRRSRRRRHSRRCRH